MDVEELRAAARSGSLAHEPEVIKSKPTPAESMEQAFAKLGQAFAKTVGAVKHALDEAWTRMTGEVGPEGYGATQMLIAITAVTTRQQVVPTGVGPIKVDIPNIDATDAAIVKMTEEIERIARSTGSSMGEVTDAVTKLRGMAGPASTPEVITSAADAREMFGEGALYANDKRIGRISRAVSSVGGCFHGAEVRMTIDLSKVGPEDDTALLEVRLGIGRLELRLGSALRGVVDKTVVLDKSWVDSVLGAIKDDRDWEYTLSLE